LFFSVSRFTPRASIVSSLVDKAIKKYGQDNVIVVGHSLGGELARQMANKYKIKAVTFNRGASFLDIFNKENKNVVGYTTNIKGNIDPVSILGKVFDKNKQIEMNPTKGVHSVENFLPTTAEEIKQTGAGLIIMKPR
jgi:esterase/lipase